MKPLNKKSLAFLIVGILLMSASFIIKRYVVLSDGIDGLIKGVSIGLLLVSVLSIAKQKKHQAQL